MRDKRFFGVLLASLLSLTSAVTVFAESRDAVISYEGEARKFITEEEGSLSQGLANMDPGEERTQILTLTNNDYHEMRFYISGEVESNIAEEGDKQAVYEIKLKKNDKEFFRGIVGSRNNPNHKASSLGLNYLEDTTLLATLKKGESVKLAITVTLDGDSTNDAYQDKHGEISFKINAEIKEVPGENTPGGENTPEGEKTGGGKTLVKAIRTGDETELILYIFGGFASLVAIAYIVKKKRGEE